MRLNRTKNAIRNTIWGIVYKICTLLFPFVMRTVLIRELGIEYLGLNSLFTSILNMLNLTELGVGSAIVYSMYKPIVENDYKTLRALMALYKRVYFIIGLIVVALGLIMMPFITFFVDGEVPSDVNIHIVFLISLCNTAVTYFLFAYRTCQLNAYQRTDVISKVTLFTNILMYTIQIIVLIKIRNFYSYMVIQPCAGALTNVINAYFVKRMYPDLYCEGKVDKSILKDIKKKVVGLMMTKVAYMSRNAFDSIIVSAMLGLTVVAMYNNYYYLSSAVSAIMVILMSSISAGIGNSIAMDSVKKNEQDMLTINFLYMSISLIAFSCFMGLYQPFMRLWVGEQYVFNDTIMIAFAVYFLVEKELNVIGQYYDAAGLWWNGKWKGVIEAIANIVLNILMCKIFGVFGIVFATIFTILFIGFPLTAYYTFKFYFKKSILKFVIQQAYQLIVFFIIGGIVYFLTRMIPFGKDLLESIFYLICRFIVSIVLSTGMLWLIYKKTKIYAQAKGWLLSHKASLMRV